jgi:hypothetical protein
MTRRPVGVVLSAIVLGVAAAFLLLLAASTLFSLLMLGHLPPTATAPGVVPPSPVFVEVSVALVGCFHLALAGWAIATLVGLVRMKPWGRISIMVIGGGLAVMGLMFALVSFALPTMMRTMPMPPNGSPAMLRGIFIGMAVVSLLIAALGVTWIVYFALRSTRNAFANQTAPVPAPPRLAATNHAHSLDFSVAQPIEPELPVVDEIVPPVAIPQATEPKRPVSITVLAILFLICAAGALPSLVLPLPIFFFGHVFAGWSAHVVILILAVWTALAGVGLLKLNKPAWFLAVAYGVVGILNSLTMVLPSGRLRMSQYFDSLTHTMNMGAPAPAINLFDPPLYNLIFVPSLILGCALIAFGIVLLWRARWAFEATPTSSQDQAAV